MKCICLVFAGSDKIMEMPEDDFAAHVASCSAWMGELESSGRHVFSGALQSPATAATIRIRGGTMTVTDGPFVETKEVLGGFTIFEARDLNEAIRTASKLDAARLGTVHVRPMMDLCIEPEDQVDTKKAAAIRKAVVAAQ